MIWKLIPFHLRGSFFLEAYSHRCYIEKMKFTFRRASLEDAKIIYENMIKVYESMENKDLFVCDDFTFVKDHIEKEGMTVVALDEDKAIVGNLIVRFPRLQEDNLGLDLGLSKEELLKVAHMESAVVLPRVRGNHLEAQMIQFAEELLKSEEYHYLMATISPLNLASIKSAQKNGFEYICTKEKYGGRIRNIYSKRV